MEPQHPSSPMPLRPPPEYLRDRLAKVEAMECADCDCGGPRQPRTGCTFECMLQARRRILAEMLREVEGETA
jgi:hypothetical protein